MSIQRNGKVLPVPEEWRAHVEDDLDMIYDDGDVPDGEFYLTDEQIDELTELIMEEEDHDHVE